MRVLLLAAGRGLRLRPITENVPKCLVPINGRPLLDIWLQRLSDAGHGPFLINTHYLSSMVEQFVKESKYVDQITLVNEPTLLGTAGTLYENKQFFSGQDAMLVHADNLCLANFSEFLKAHRNRSDYCCMTMMVFETDAPRSAGIVEINKLGVVTNFYEKQEKPPGNLANAAVYILAREMVLGLEKLRDFSTEVIPKFINRIQTYRTNEVLIDIGTPSTYQKANDLELG